MKVIYRPGTPDGLVGKSFHVEIVSMRTMTNPHIKMPMLKQIQIRYKDGTKEWVDGNSFLNGIDMTSSAVEKQTI